MAAHVLRHDVHERAHQSKFIGKSVARVGAEDDDLGLFHTELKTRFVGEFLRDREHPLQIRSGVCNEAYIVSVLVLSK